MENWSFLTNHAVCADIARDPGARLRDIAAALEITERSAYGIVTDPTRAGYVVKEKDGRRNRYLSRRTFAARPGGPSALPSATSSPTSMGKEAEQEQADSPLNSVSSCPGNRGKLPRVVG